jgi:succinate dehydrogenase / fumarate reductase cytochrome b subunit
MAATSTAKPPAAPASPHPPSKKSKIWAVEFYRSAVGKKWVMAVSGLVMVGFVLFHMIGNLKMYLGAGDLNHYAEFLRHLLVPILPRTVALWLMRVGLMAAVFFHIHAAATLTRMNQRSRPEAYATPRDYVAANFASRTTRWTGSIIALYVVFHLMDLTWGVGKGKHFVRGDAYHNLVYSLSKWPIAIVYIVCNIAVAIHLFHGIWSMFQSLGWNNPKFNAWRRSIAAGVSTLIGVGNVLFPIMVLAKVVK